MWFFLAFLSAFFSALSNIARRTHGSLANPAELSWWSLLFAFPTCLGLLVLSKEQYYTSTAFLIPMLIAGVLNSFASVLQFKAYKLADASIVSPISNLLPLLLVATTFIIIGTRPGWGTFVGIMFVVAGVYYSSVSGKHALSHPLQQMFKNKGSRAMFGAIVLWSVSAVAEKIALRSASPTFLSLFTVSVMFVCISIYLLLTLPQKRRVKHGEKVLRKWGWHIAAISTFSTLSVFFQLHAIALTNPSAVLAVKRLDVLLTVLFAGLLLREKHILKRFEGSVLALLGIAIVYIFN